MVLAFHQPLAGRVTIPEDQVQAIGPRSNDEAVTGAPLPAAVQRSSAARTASMRISSVNLAFSAENARLVLTV
jgi:hypothetical protein